MTTQEQDQPDAASSKTRREDTAKQAWDDEGGSLHPDETKVETAELPEPVDQEAIDEPGEAEDQQQPS